MKNKGIPIERLVFAFEQKPRDKREREGNFTAIRVLDSERVHFNTLETMQVPLGHADHNYTIGIAYDLKKN